MTKIKNSKGILKILLIALAVVLSIGALLVGYVVIDDLTVSLNKADFNSERIPYQFYGYRIMGIADFHDSHYYEQIINLAVKEKPDIILFLGDMTELSSDTYDNLSALLDGLPAEIPKYGVLGNHEVWSLKVEEIEKLLNDKGVQILNDSLVTIERDGASIDIVGVRDTQEGDDDFNGKWQIENMQQYLTNVLDKNRFSIVACHRANLYPWLNNLPGGLMLSGHMHGGLVRIPYVGGLFSPGGTIMPEYDKGFYNQGEMPMFVSVGSDFRMEKMRVLNGPEVVLLTLKN